MTTEEYNVLVEQSQPHEVFKTTWDSYYAFDFGDTFLPKVKAYNGKAIRVYDGANLFKNSQKADRQLLPLENNSDLITVVSYTYPKGVEAENKKSRIQPANHELCMFVEVEENESISIDLKYGEVFSNALKAHNIDTSKTFKTDINTFKAHFNNTITHDNLIRYVLKTQGIIDDDVYNILRQRLFTPDVVNYINTFKIADAYYIRIEVEKTQKDVYFKAIEPKVYEAINFPQDNEILVWLVSEDCERFNDSFIHVSFGNQVAKDVKNEVITELYVGQLILTEIRNHYGNIISKQKVNTAAKRGFNNALIAIWKNKKIANDPSAKKLFEKSPILFITTQIAHHTISELDVFWQNDNVWNPKVHPFKPLFPDDTHYNAIICGLINGIIDEAKAVPELVIFFNEMRSDEAKRQEFSDSIDALINEEGIIKELLKELLHNSIKGYEEAFNKGNMEKLYYNFAHDAIQIVSLLIGVFQLVKGVASFVNMTKKAFVYLKRYGKEGIDRLKKLNKKQIGEVFDDFDSGIKNKTRKATPDDIEKLAKIRKRFNAGKKKNVANTIGEIGGEKIDLQSRSGISKGTPENFDNFEAVKLENYKYLEGPEPFKVNHTEQKQIEYLFQKFKENKKVTGRIEIISDLKICKNCDWLIDVFQKDFPNIEITRVWVRTKLK